MRRAMALAERGRGGVGTNPLVGAVVVRGGRIVGEGWHERFGGPHAEAIALARAGERARGATLYVTLEPCSRLGKTPPCTRMVIASRIRQVILGLADPLEHGRGAAELRRARITVRGGPLAGEIRAQNREFLTRLVTRRPFVILKLAATLDGRIADFKGHSRWITSPAARTFTRGLRGKVDAIMVGAGTAVADNPGLNAPGSGAGPLKIIVDSRARTSPRSKLFLRGRVLMAVTAAAPRARLSALVDRGATVLVVPAHRGRVALAPLLRRLHAIGIGSIFSEGGAELAGALVSERLVDRVLMVLSPQLLGGTGSRPAVGGPNRPLFKALKLAPPRIHAVGPDTVFDALCGPAARVPSTAGLRPALRARREGRHR